MGKFAIEGSRYFKNSKVTHFYNAKAANFYFDKAAHFYDINAAKYNYANAYYGRTASGSIADTSTMSTKTPTS